MRRSQLFTWTIACLLLVSACKWETTKTALKKGDVLKSSLESFEKNRQKLSDKVITSLEDAEKELTSENPDLPKASKDFEKEWTSIQGRYGKLKDDFAKVGASSEAYFLQLDQLSSEINNESLRNEELAKNQDLRKTWDATYQKAGISIQKIETVLESGNDFHRVLVASSIRQKLEQNVVELERIASQAKELLADLEVFTEEGRKLVEG